MSPKLSRGYETITKSKMITKIGEWQEFKSNNNKQNGGRS